jgi:hypothetical protein
MSVLELITMTKKKDDNSSQTSYVVDEKYKREYVSPAHPPPVQEKYRKEYVGNATNEKKEDRGPYFVLRGKKVYENEMKPIWRHLKYDIGSFKRNIPFAVYEDVDRFIGDLSKPSKDLDYFYISQPFQRKYLLRLVDAIKKITSNEDKQARIAISLVQNIPYDYVEMTLRQRKIAFDKFPYEVLYEIKGVCNEKSRLLAFLLKELGFGVALFNFKRENHMAVGIKCTDPANYESKGTKYAFIEATGPTAIGDIDRMYRGYIQLISMPDVTKICDGKTFSNKISPDFEEFGKIYMVLLALVFAMIFLFFFIGLERYEVWPFIATFLLIALPIGFYIIKSFIGVVLNKEF